MKDITVKELQEKLKKYNEKHDSYTVEITEHNVFLARSDGFNISFSLNNIIEKLDSVNEP